MGREREIDTETGPQGSFPTTLWTVVLKAGAASETVRRSALEELIRTYWRPVYVYIRRKSGDRESAKDHTQGFFAALLERDAFQGLTPQGGKFRSYLLTVLRNFLADATDRAQALKRGGGKVTVGIDFEAVDREADLLIPSHESPEEAFRRNGP